MSDCLTPNALPVHQGSLSQSHADSTAFAKKKEKNFSQKNSAFLK